MMNNILVTDLNLDSVGHPSAWNVTLELRICV